MKVKVYQYKEDGVDCTDVVVEEVGKLYPFLSSIYDLEEPIKNFTGYAWLQVEENLPDDAILVQEYDTEE